MSDKKRKKTIEIPDESDGEKPAKHEPFLFYGNPGEDRPVRVGTAPDGSPVYAPPRRYWIKLGA